MGYLTMAGQLILCLSILIVLHEMGHFFPAKWFGTRVEKFYLFFNPWFSLFKIKKGETEYGIGWLPLGGYVKISGMVDESFDSEQLQGEPQPWEFRSKPAWQRLIIMLGGVTVNFILGFLIYIMIIFVWGKEYIPNESVKDGIIALELGQKLGLKDGDKILALGDEAFTKFDDRLFFRKIVFGEAKTITVQRDGQRVAIPVDEKVARSLATYKNKDKFFFGPRFPFIVDKTDPGTPAAKAKLQKGDRVIAFNGKPTPYFHEFRKEAETHPDQDITLTLVRNDVDTVEVKLHTTESGTIGARTKALEFKREEFTLAQSIPAGINEGWSALSLQVKALGQMISGKMKAKENLGGFLSIADTFGGNWIWSRFWQLTAMLSLVLAFMNLLPIPALDGGHVIFLLYEVITGRKPSDKFMEYATMVGFIFIFGLILYVNGLDIFRRIFGWVLF
jgi:regulator of sigma E protease